MLFYVEISKYKDNQFFLSKATEFEKKALMNKHVLEYK